MIELMTRLCFLQKVRLTECRAGFVQTDLLKKLFLLLCYTH